MIYTFILILEILIKYTYPTYSFDNIKILIKKELPQDFSGNIFSKPDSFYLNKANKAIIENRKNISNFQEIFNNYNNYIFHDSFIISNNETKFEILPVSFKNKVHLFLLRNTEIYDFCNKELIFGENEKIIKINNIEKNTLAILFSNTNLILYNFSFSFQTKENILINNLEENYCFLDKIIEISPVKDFFKLKKLQNIFVTLDFHGKFNFYNLKNYFMCRYQKYENIKQIQLGYYDQYYLNGLNKKFLYICYDNRLALIKIGKKINIKKIYVLNNEKVSSIYNLNNHQILVGTDKGNLHIISLKNSILNFDGIINICKENVELISQEKINYLICIKCGKYFLLIDLKGKFSEKDFEINIYKEFRLVIIFFLIFSFTKISKDKIVFFYKKIFNNNIEEEE